jgi:hypothetical protein
MIIDNLLELPVAANIERTLTDSYFPWYWCNSSLYGDFENYDGLKNFQFTHNFYVDGSPKSSYVDMLNPLFMALEKRIDSKIKTVFRAKANLLPNMQMTDFELSKEIHVDHSLDQYNSFVYYVTNSDGNTIIYSDDDEIVESVNPVFNSGVFFKSKMKHRATPPVLHKRRIVLNFILEF